MLSLPAPGVVKGAAMRCAWLKRAPTSSPSTSSRITRRSATRCPARPIWAKPSGRSRRWAAGSSQPRPTFATLLELRAALDAGVAELGRLDIVCANAGIYTVQSWDQVTPEVWQDTIDTNLTGVWNTMVVAIPHLITAGGGSIIATSSTAGIKGMPFLAPYVAAKHAVVGICRSLANELAGQRIRVNTVHPAGVDTPMVAGLETLEPFIKGSPELGAIFSNSLSVEALDPREVSNAVLYLASDEARYVTGLALSVDAGNAIR